MITNHLTLKSLQFQLCVLLLCLFFVSDGLAQESIRWFKPQQAQSTGYGDQDFLYFEGAFYPQSQGNLPYYIKDFQLSDANVIVTATLSHCIFLDLTIEEQAVVSPGDVPSSEIRTTTEIIHIRKEPFARLSFLPFRKDPDSEKLQKLVSFEVSIVTAPDPRTEGTESRLINYADHSVLASGSWYKFRVKETGIYKVTFNDLTTMGLNPGSIDPKNLRIYGNGGAMLPESNAKTRPDDLIQNAILVVGEEDGSFDPGDYILFYGQSPVKWTYNNYTQKFSHQLNYYSDYTYYFITADQGEGLRIQTEASATGPITHHVSKFTDYAYHDLDQLNLIKSGKIWYGEKFDLKLTYDLPAFHFPNIDDLTQVVFEADVAARSTSGSNFKLFVNTGEAANINVQPISPAFNTDYAYPGTALKRFFLNTPVVNVRATYYPSTVNSIGWLNYVEFNVCRNLIFVPSQMAFRTMEGVGAGNITQFTLSGTNASTVIWDVTTPSLARKLDPVIEGNNMIFQLSTDALREFIAFDGTSYLSILPGKRIENQDLHALTATDMVIFVHPDFIAEADRLATLHRNEGMSVMLVNPEKVYNEFSSGAQDIGALRDFVKMLYDEAPQGQEPRYLLLFGDASYDYKDIIEGNTNFVPTFQSTNALKPTESYATDDFFGLMDTNEGGNSIGNLDLGVGRLPVKTYKEAKEAVDKISRYAGNQSDTLGCQTFSSSVPRFGDWRNLICFIADDEDNNLHFDQAETLSDFVDTAYKQYNIDKIYFDAYKESSTSGGQRYPDVNEAINKRVEKGALIINYTGHGGETGWAHERVLEVADINDWANKMDMPVFVTATCEFSRFDDPERTSAGEYVFLNPDGGGIALFTTTRLSFSSTNFSLNLNFYYNVFRKIDGSYPKMGDVMRMAKTPSNPNLLNFVLLGDPALGIVYPFYNVKTQSINGNPVSLTPDTLKAFSKITVTGQIEDDQGIKVENFDGYLYPTIFDKPLEVVTLGNNIESSPAHFFLQKNLIYKGKVKVIDGNFSFSFMVPRDIAYKYGQGKISYYAENGQIDASGSYENFVIGGSETNFEPDAEGPEIRLFLNDTNFVSGGMTDEKPFLLALVRDEHGINTVGNGIGHDIVATLDDNTEQSVVLNDFYEADLDSYQSGTIRYPYSGLTEGMHTLKLKVWDIYNNSTEAETKFFVYHSGDFIVEKLRNFPNPFSDQTAFYFDHNQSCCELDIKIDIFDLTGSLVASLQSKVLPEGYQVGPITWSGIGHNGARLARGLYIYRLHVVNDNGDHQIKSSKLVLLK